MVHFLNREMHLRKSFQCLKRQRRGFLRQPINYFDAKEQDTPVARANSSRNTLYGTTDYGLRAIAFRSASNTRPSWDCETLNRRKPVADCDRLKALPGARTMFSASASRATSAASMPSGSWLHKNMPA